MFVFVQKIKLSNGLYVEVGGSSVSGGGSILDSGFSVVGGLSVYVLFFLRLLTCICVLISFD
jgi:hypothetical protein